MSETPVPATASVPAAGVDIIGLARDHAAALAKIAALEAAHKTVESEKATLAAEAEKHRTEAAARQQEIEAARVASATERRNAEIIRAATEAGARDPKDILALLPGDALKDGANGSVEGLTEALGKLAKDKPWLFKAASSADTGHKPNPKAATDKPVADMTADEWKAARAAMLAGRK